MKNLLFFSILIFVLSFSGVGHAFPSGCRIFGHETPTLLARNFQLTSAQKAAHEAITTDLYNGRVIAAERFSKNGNRTELWLVQVQNPATGRIRKALFKPRQYGDNEGWNRVPMEYVVYEMGLLLGMDYIPPSAYRKQWNGNPITIGGQTYSEGALLFFVSGTHALQSVPVRQWDLKMDYKEIDKELFLSDTRVLDVLMQNPDRHVDNFMRGEHWVDGVYRPLLIDNAASLRPGTNTHMGHPDAFGYGPVVKFREQTLEYLKGLTREKLEKLSEFITPDEINGILARRNVILDYAQKLIDKNGYDNVVIRRGTSLPKNDAETKKEVAHVSASGF
ncbi:MAG: hypothetical protein HYV97_07505 [Bdellovibrio sp.]|nr:hypothetical protein [Bdellovibrio sp.]